MLVSSALAAIIGINSWVAFGIGFVGSVAGGWTCQSAIEYLGEKSMTQEEIDIIVNDLLPPEGIYKKALKELNFEENTSLGEIKRQRKIDALKYHPDKIVPKKDASEEDI